jgi:hypothetical protein
VKECSAFGTTTFGLAPSFDGAALISSCVPWLNEAKVLCQTMVVPSVTSCDAGSRSA